MMPRNRVCFLAAAALAVLLVGCEGFGGDCESHADCEAGQCCLDGECVFQGEAQCPSGDADTDSDVDTDSDTDSDTDTDTGANRFTGLVVDFATKIPLFGMTVAPVDNVTGAPLAGVDAVISSRDEDVNVIFNGLPLGKIGIVVDGKAGNPAMIDTYQFHIASNAKQQVLWAVDDQTRQFAPALAGIAVEPGKALLFGQLLWRDASGDEWPVDCGSVRLTVNGQEAGEVVYFGDNGLPTTPDEQDSINPANGLFMAANIPAGSVARLEGRDPAGQNVAEVSFPVFGSAVTVQTLLVGPGHAQNPGGCD